MKPHKIFYILICSVLTLFWTFPVLGVPKYTDKETALELARFLDKGNFDNRYTISSTYVQNDNIQDYYISVILSDGSSQKWYINQIYKWSRDDKLKLANNQSILFPDNNDSRFVILDKNKFHRLALKANIYVKEYEAGDPLEGNQFRFLIKSFNLINPGEIAFGRNARGSKYRYIIDLFNGISELLTYEDAYGLMKNKHLFYEQQLTAPTFERAYHVTKIVAHEKKIPEDGVSQFGIEILFDQPIQINGDHFPYEIYERTQYNKRTKSQKQEFVLDITLPNSEKKFEIAPISNLEYLYNISVVKNPKYSKRVLLRASFNPTVMDLPPVVYKNSDNSVFVSFFNLIDQTVLSRSMLLEAKKREDAERASAKDIRITKAIKKDSDFGRAFINAANAAKESDGITDLKLKQEKLITGIKLFEEAALYAETDDQLFSALSSRNQLRETYIATAIKVVTQKLGTETLDNSEVSDAMLILDQAEAFTGNQQLLKKIDVLREKVIAKQ
jgi:hypothetical protein